MSNLSRLGIILFYGMATLLACSHANALVVKAQGGFQSAPVGPGIEYVALEDETTTIDEVLQITNWQTVTGRHASFGFDNRPHWLRFHVQNDHTWPINILIALRNNYLDNVDLYIVDPGGNIRDHQVSGDQRAARERPIRHPENIHPVALSASERVSIYIRLQSSSALNIPIQLWEQDVYLAFDYARTVAVGIFLGLMIMFSLYHLMIAALTRDSAALFYAVFVFAVFVMFAYRKGIPPSLSNAWAPSTETANILAMSVTGFSLCFFTSIILRLRSAIPRLADTMKWAGLIALAPILAYVVVDYSWVIRFSLGYSLSLIALFTLAVLLRLKDGYPPAKPMVIGSVFGITGNSLGILSSIDVVSITFELEAIIFASNALMALFFALTLSFRINMDRVLLEEAQRQHTHELDELVRQRTEELENVNQQLRLVSITDGLTRLNNRRHFDETLKTAYNRAFREKGSLAILLLDIDHFKQLNDTYGHSYGDECLKSLGRNIKRCLRRPRDMAARYGGEEFVILLPDTELQGALHLAEVLRQRVESTVIRDNDIEASMTISVGVAAEIPAHRDQHEALLQKADQWLYRAKHEGRNRVAGDL